METVAFYSYKGGVGRTLLLANTARFLARAGRRVVALDLDLEAPGLHYKLGTSELLRRATDGSLRGAIDELLGLMEGDQQRPSLRDTAVEVSLPADVTGSLLLIPAGSAPSHAYWAAMDRLNQLLRDHRRSGGLPEAVLELQARIADELAPDYLLIDLRSGITELGGLATSILADHVVCITTMSSESVAGTRVVADALRNAPRLSSQAPVRIDFVITRGSSDSVDSPGVSNLRAELGDFVAVLPHDFAPTLRWIADAFGLSKQAAEIAGVRTTNKSIQNIIPEAYELRSEVAYEVIRFLESKALEPSLTAKGKILLHDVLKPVLYEDEGNSANALFAFFAETEAFLRKNIGSFLDSLKLKAADVYPNRDLVGFGELLEGFARAIILGDHPARDLSLGWESLIELRSDVYQARYTLNQWRNAVSVLLTQSNRIEALLSAVTATVSRA